MVVEPEHMLLNRLPSLRDCVSKQVVDNTVIAIERCMQQILHAVGPLTCRKLLLGCYETEAVYLGNLMRIFAYLTGTQDQHARVAEPVHEKCCRDYDDDDA